MKRRLQHIGAMIALLLLGLTGRAQNPTVPSTMQFGDMELKITNAAQKKIQAHVDNYRRSPKYFQQKVDLANLYFPIIEAKFKEENVPEDFKYLIIQESGFVSDAVSSSNAVGYWQFKEATATEVGITVNSKVDERKNISAASTGAAKYFKFNNRYFSNWIYALQAYNQGAGGTQKVADPKYFGKKKMEIDGSTHWYVLKFLAHKVAYEGAVGGQSNMGFYLREYHTKNETLKEIAKEYKLDLDQLSDYNKWLNASRIPSDKDYTVLLTMPGKGTSTTAPKGTKPTPELAKEVKIDLDKKEVKITTSPGMPDITIKMRKQRAQEQADYLEANPHIFARLNGLNAIKSISGDTKDKLALAGGISTDKFLKYNDLESFDPIITGQFYYLQNKRRRSKAYYHTVKWDETLWGISQDYGMHVSAIKKKNGIGEYHELKAGRVLYMRKKRPKDKAVKFEDPGPKPQPKKEVVLDLPELPKQDKELKKEVKEIMKEGEHDLPPIPKEPVVEEVKHDMEEAEIEVKETKEEQPVISTPKTDPVTEPSTSDVIMHTVQPGETLYSISKKYVVDVATLKYWNKLENEALEVDQRLIVAIKDTGTPAPKNEVEHTVIMGETLYSISRKYGVTIDEILKWNNKTDASLSEGEKLKIKR